MFSSDDGSKGGGAPAGGRGGGGAPLGGGGGGPPPRRLQDAPAEGVFNSTTYENDVLRISKYMNLYGMFEKFDGKNYSVHDPNINSNLFEWKKYDSNILKNSHGQYELRFNHST